MTTKNTTHQATYKARMREAGYKRVEVYEPAPLVEAMDKDRGEQSRAEYIHDALLARLGEY